MRFTGEGGKQRKYAVFWNPFFSPGSIFILSKREFWRRGRVETMNKVQKEIVWFLLVDKNIFLKIIIIVIMVFFNAIGIFVGWIDWFNSHQILLLKSSFRGHLWFKNIDFSMEFICICEISRNCIYFMFSDVQGHGTSAIISFNTIPCYDTVITFMRCWTSVESEFEEGFKATLSIHAFAA